MKIIDLLNKIAKGEEVPKKFKLCDNHHTYELIKYPICGVEITNYKDEDGDYLFGSEYELVLMLNDEVEIIEEEKEIRKLPNEIQQPRNFEEVVYIAEDLVRKINELIDEINKLKRDKE